MIESHPLKLNAMINSDSQTVSAVAAAGEVFRAFGGERVARTVIGRGGDLLDFHRTFQANVGTDPNALDHASGITLTEADYREYSISRLLTTLLQQRAAHDLPAVDPFDRNLDAERQQNANERRVSSFENAAAGNRLPFAVLLRDYNISQAPIGTTLGTQYTPDALRGYLPLASLGAQVIAMPPRSGSLRVPVVNGDLAAVTFLGEIAEVTESQPNTGLVDLAPKRVSAFVEVSRMALIQGGRHLDRILARVIFGKIRSVIEDAAINGTGAADTPTGVRNVVGVGNIAAGVNGASLTWAHLQDLVELPAASNVSENASGFLVNPKTRKYLARTQRATNLPFIYDGGALPLLGHRAEMSTLIPGNLTKGTSTGVCSSVVFSADWSNLLIVFYGSPEVTVDPYTQIGAGKVRVIVDSYIGIGVLHPSAFAKIDDALAP